MKRKIFSKKILSAVLSVSLLAGIVLPTYTNASDTVSLNVKTYPKMDIMVTSNETAVDMTNFKTDLFEELATYGIDTNTINLETIERAELSSNSTDASTIFNSWGRIGWTGQWSVVSVGGISTIQNAENTDNYTGFYYPDDYSSTDMVIEFDNRTTNADDDAMGCMFRFNLTNDSTNSKTKTCSTYVFLLDKHDTSGKGISNGAYNGLLKITNKTFAHGSVEKLATIPSVTWTRNTWAHYKIEVKGNNIKIYQNDKLIIDYTDTSATAIESGSYGLFSYSQPYAQYRNFVAQTSNAKSFKDTLLQPSWREDADHYIINVDDVVDENFTNTSSVGEILTRTINDDISFIQWGTDTNKEVMSNFISQNNDNGTFIDNSDYALAVKQTAKYIYDQYETTTADEQLVVVNDPVQLEVNPIGLATNTADEEYPNGKWIIHHDAKYYANGTGQSEFAEAFQSDLSVTFDKPGKYTIYFEEDLIKTVYAHRLPIANFDMKLNDDKTLTLTNNSYDLDSNNDTYGYGNGIVNIQWQWKNMNDATWTDGIPTETLIDGETYIVQLRVQDEQGAWSAQTSKYITLDKAVSVPPVASFSYGSSTIFTNNSLDVLDSSYDPTGLNITEYQWVLKKDKVNVATYTTTTPKVSFTDLGVGTYSYTLKVKNSNNLWSDGYTKSFTVIEDTVAPSVMIDPTYSDWGDSSAINFEFSDSGSGFAKFRYSYDTNQTQPSDTSDTWTEWSTKDNGSLTIGEDGVWYLHIQALDNNNNQLDRTVGVYRIDTTDPVISQISVDSTSIARTNNITIIASDVTSGLKRDAYRFVNEETGEDSGYISSNVYGAKSNGTFMVYVKDQNNNEVSTSIVVNKVDRVAPSVINFNTSTEDWTDEVIASISIEDSFAGIGTNSYALEKLTEENNTNENTNQQAKTFVIDTLFNLQDVQAKTIDDVVVTTVDTDNVDITKLQWQDNNQFSITENGTYNLYARDAANNISVVTFTINNIDDVKPNIERIEKSTTELTNQNVTISIIGAKDDNIGLADKPYSFDNGDTWVSNNSFTIKENGTYKILVKDKLDNIYEETYVIDNIDKNIPTISTLETTTNDTREYVTLNISLKEDREIYGYVLSTKSTLPNDNEYITIDDTGEDKTVLSGTYKVTRSGIYYLYAKDVAGNVLVKKITVSTLVTGIDFTQEQVTEYQEVTEEGDYDTMVYATQHSTFGVVIPKTIILDGQSGIGNFQTSVVGNIAGVETVDVTAPETFLLKDSDNIKNSIVATISQDKDTFAWRDIVTETTSNGSIVAKDITAGRWNGTFNFNIKLGNNQNTINSIGSTPNDSYSLVIDDSAIEIVD